MNKQTKILIGVGVIGLAYIIYNQTQKKDKIFANAVGNRRQKTPKEIEYCQKKCKGSENFGLCMYECVNNILDMRARKRLGI